MSPQPASAASRQQGDAAVVIERVDKRFGEVHALRGLSATIRYGRLTGLVGPDGAGKTTLMRIMTGLLVPDAGSVALAGFDVVKDNDAIHVASGYMPQRFGLYEDLSVMENMRLYARLRGMDADSHTNLFAELLEFTRLGPFTTRLAGKLSGGMKQKLGLACALAHEPRVLLLDEPTNGVDPVSRRDFWKILHELAHERGATVFVSTAYLDEAERCARLALLHEGRFLALDTPAGVKRLVKLSSLDAHFGPEGASIGAWHAQGEAALRESGVAWTFLRPGGFMTNALNWAHGIRAAGKIRASTGEGRIAMIHPDDLAEVAVAALTLPAFDGQTLELTGPRALTYAEMAELLGRALGKPVAFVPFSDADARQQLLGLGMPAEEADGLVELWRSVREGALSRVTDTVQRVLGRPARTFEAWVEENLAAFR